jgi:hypothetical protein
MARVIADRGQRDCALVPARGELDVRDDPHPRGGLRLDDAGPNFPALDLDDLDVPDSEVGHLTDLCDALDGRAPDGLGIWQLIGHDPTDKMAAYRIAEQYGEKLYTGVIYRQDGLPEYTDLHRQIKESAKATNLYPVQQIFEKNFLVR